MLFSEHGRKINTMVPGQHPSRDYSRIFVLYSWPRSLRACPRTDKIWFQNVFRSTIMKMLWLPGEKGEKALPEFHFITQGLSTEGL